MATEVIGGATREFYTGGGKMMQGMQGNVEMRNLLANQFLNRAPNMNQMVPNMNQMAPNMNQMAAYNGMQFIPMQQGQYNNCGNGMGEMAAVPNKKKRRKRKKKKYYSSSSNSSSSSSDSSSDEEKKKKSKKKNKKKAIDVID